VLCVCEQFSFVFYMHTKHDSQKGFHESSFAFHFSFAPRNIFSRLNYARAQGKWNQPDASLLKRFLMDFWEQWKLLKLFTIDFFLSDYSRVETPSELVFLSRAAWFPIKYLILISTPIDGLDWIGSACYITRFGSASVAAAFNKTIFPRNENWVKLMLLRIHQNRVAMLSVCVCVWK
jgi:hypothetical protein